MRATATPEALNEQLEQMHAKLRRQRRMIDEQLHALEVWMDDGQLMTPSGDLMLVLYVAFGSAKAVAQFANGQGWCLPSKKGEGHPPRQWQPVDVYDLLEGKEVKGCPAAASQVLKRMSGYAGTRSHTVSRGAYTG